MTKIVRISRKMRMVKLKRRARGHFVMLIKTSMHLIEGNLGHISPAKARYVKGEANFPTMVVGARENGAFELTSAVDRFASFFFFSYF